MRREDHIPAIVYGPGMDPIAVSVVRRDLRLALSGPAGVNTVLDLTVDGTVYPAIVKELQRHPVRRTVSHVDFLQVNLNEEIVISVPVRLDVDVSSMDACAQAGAAALKDPKRQVPTTDFLISPDLSGALDDVITQYWNNPSMKVDEFVTKFTGAMQTGG